MRNRAFFDLISSSDFPLAVVCAFEAPNLPYIEFVVRLEELVSAPTSGTLGEFAHLGIASSTAPMEALAIARALNNVLDGVDVYADQVNAIAFKRLFADTDGPEFNLRPFDEASLPPYCKPWDLSGHGTFEQHNYVNWMLHPPEEPPKCLEGQNEALSYRARLCASRFYRQ